jgi:putative flippase GtrA
MIEINKKSFWELIKYGLVGLVNTGVTALVLFVTTDFLQWPLLMSNITGYIIGLTTSFFLNKSFTFQSQGDTLKKALMFLAVFVVCYLLQLWVVFLIRDSIQNDTLSQLVGMLVYTPTGFVLNKLFTFNDKWFVKGNEHQEELSEFASTEENEVKDA